MLECAIEEHKCKLKGSDKTLKIRVPVSQLFPWEVEGVKVLLYADFSYYMERSFPETDFTFPEIGLAPELKTAFEPWIKNEGPPPPHVILRDMQWLESRKVPPGIRSKAGPDPRPHLSLQRCFFTTGENLGEITERFGLPDVPDVMQPNITYRKMDEGIVLITSSSTRVSYAFYELKQIY
jgi:hypothetical protein